MQHNRQTTLMFRPKRSILEMVSVREDSLTIIIGTNDGLGMAREAARDLKTVESVATEERTMKNSISYFQGEEDAGGREREREKRPSIGFDGLTNQGAEKDLLLIRWKVFGNGHRRFTAIVGDVRIGAVRNQQTRGGKFQRSNTETREREFPEDERKSRRTYATCNGVVCVRSEMFGSNPALSKTRKHSS